MQSAENYQQEIEQNGFALIGECLSAAEIERIDGALTAGLAQHARDASIRSKASVYAVRNLLEMAPDLRGLASWPPIRRLVEPVLGPRAAIVRTILFDKSPTTNWGVFWHQDLMIAVRARQEVPGFERWSTKAGVVHVEPPTDLLEQMLTVRLHLDCCTAGNGPLRVIAGSHRHGRLTDAEIERHRTGGPVVDCVVPAGGAVVMRPLLLHSSHKAAAEGRRRVIHLEFAAEDLPAPLEWFERGAVAGAG